MNKTIKSVSLLKLILERSKSDYIEVFIPFVASLILKKDYREIEIETFCSDFCEEYGLNIPYHPTQTILRRAKTRGLIEKSGDGKFKPVRKNLLKHDISNKTIEKTKEVDTLIRKFIDYSKSQFQKSFDFENAESILIAYLKDNDKDILFAFSDVSILPKIDAKKEQKYILNRFVQYLYDNDYSSYRLICQIITGYIFANCIFYDEPSHFL